MQTTVAVQTHPTTSQDWLLITNGCVNHASSVCFGNMSSPIKFALCDTDMLTLSIIDKNGNVWHKATNGIL